MSDDIVIDSIKKMLQLNMPEDEILASLIDAGVDYDYAANMLDSIKNNKPAKDPKLSKRLAPQQVPELKQEESDESIDNALEEPVSENQNNQFKEVDKTSLGVWQEGVTTIITQKLDEIEEKQKTLDNDIKANVTAITTPELAKMRTIIDSQRSLLGSKLDMSVASKLKEIKQQVDNTLKELQDINANTQKKLDNIDTLNKSMMDLKITLKEQIETVNNLKESLETTLDSFKKESARELTKLFDQYRAQLDDITNRTNSTMNLASKILESLVNASKNKIDAYLNSKINSFMTDLQAKLNVDNIKLALDKLNTVKDIEAKIGTVVDNKIANFVSSQNTTKFDDSIIDLNKRLMELERYSKSASSEDLDDINAKLDELKMYNEQNANLIAKLIKDKDSERPVNNKKK